MRATPDDILGMAFFARVVETGSFSDAARSLGLSKSAVSARVSRLEERLGVQLLHRTTRKLALTADGVRLYERAARVAAEADEAAELAAGASSSPRGVLRVFAPSAFAQQHLSRPIGEFVQAWPDVRIELRLGDRIPDIGADGIDVSIVIAQRLTDSSLTARKLATARVVTCAAPAYLRRKGIPFRPQDLVQHDCLSHSAAQFQDWHFDTDEGGVSITARSKIVVDDISFLHAAALDGAGVAMFPEPIVSADVEAGRLHPVLDDYQSIELAISALHMHGQKPPASIRAFLDHLAAWFRKPRWVETSRRVRPATSTKTTHAFPMTEQDIRRLDAIAKLYDDVDGEGTARLRQRLARAKATPAAKIPRSTVTMNSRFVCRDASGREYELSLVYPWDARDHRVSIVTVEGASLLGASIGASVEVGGRPMKIAAIPYQPEAAGDHHL